MDPHRPRLTHKLDQLGEAYKPVAAFLGTFRRALLEEGFSEDQVTKLCEAWLASMIESGTMPEPPPKYIEERIWYNGSEFTRLRRNDDSE